MFQLSPDVKYLKLRLSLFYVGLFTSAGIYLPFWPLWLAERGLSSSQIGIVLAVGMSAKVIGNPLAGGIVDRLGKRRGTMIALSAASVVLISLFALAHDFWTILAISLFSSAAYAGLFPLIENLTLMSAQARKFDYGHIRLWGSLSFIFCATLGGGIIAQADGAWVIQAMLACGMATLFAASFLLPEATIRLEAGTQRGSFRDLLRGRGFLLFLAAAAAVQVSHTIYYGFSALHWRKAGIGEGVIGALWAEGVIVEVILFIFANRILRHLSPARLIFIGGAAGLIRWTAIGLTSWLPALLLVQALHALTFAAAHLGAMHYLLRETPPELSGRAQGLYSSAVMGVGTGLGMLVSGTLYQSLEGGAFLVMAALSTLGAALALGIDRKPRSG
jgi:PPP family 3-phenylpropionic acid transporter